MTSSDSVPRAAPRRSELHRADDGRRIRRAIAPRHRPNPGRLAMTLPRRLVRDGQVHAQAIERLNTAADDRQRLIEQNDAIQGAAGDRGAVALAAANEQLATRQAWVEYIEHGY